MADPEITIRARYRRVVQVKAYETSEAELFIEETFPGEMTPEGIRETASAQFQIIKAQVLMELGLSFGQDEATGIILEAFPGTEVVENRPKAPKGPKRLSPVSNEAPARSTEDRGSYTDPTDTYDAEAEDEPAPAPRNRAGAGQARRPMATGGSTAGNPQRRPRAGGSGGRGRPSGSRSGGTSDVTGDDLLNLYLENPRDWFDNREDKQSETSPDFRHKSIKGSNGYSLGIWLGKDTPQWFLEEIGEEGF